jgi:endonuclease YncB( thermonuclease family)
MVNIRAAALTLLVAACAATASETRTGRVVAIADGDTLTLLDASKVQHRIRLDGIDAPEAKQAFGNRARQSLAELAHQQEAVAGCHKIDKYKRQVCVVRVNGIDVGLEQIKRGWRGISSATRPRPRRIALPTLRPSARLGGRARPLA